jgi:hypothetical protein
MARRERVVERTGKPPVITCVVDHVALLRLVGSAQIMAEQCAYLLELAAAPYIDMQVLPVIGHPAMESGLLIADTSAAYTEHLGGGAVYIEPDRVEGFEGIFRAIRGECYRASESAAIVRKARGLWTGVSRATAGQTAATASRRLRAAE